MFTETTSFRNPAECSTSESTGPVLTISSPMLDDVLKYLLHLLENTKINYILHMILRVKENGRGSLVPWQTPWKRKGLYTLKRFFWSSYQL